MTTDTQKLRDAVASWPLEDQDELVFGKAVQPHCSVCHPGAPQRAAVRR